MDDEILEALNENPFQHHEQKLDVLHTIHFLNPFFKNKYAKNRFLNLCFKEEFIKVRSLKLHAQGF
jgi:hypothetical protein